MTPRVPERLFQGTLDALILQALADGPRHGYGIAAWIESTSAAALEIADAALYTALHKMEDRGWIAAEWGASENNRKARFYRLTKSGRKQLEAETESWTRMAAAVARVLETA